MRIEKEVAGKRKRRRRRRFYLTVSFISQAKAKKAGLCMFGREPGQKTTRTVPIRAAQSAETSALGRNGTRILVGHC